MSIKLIIGPMWAGKSSQMSADVERHQLARRFCVIVKYSGDTRYISSGVKTHSGREYTNVTTIIAGTLREIMNDVKGCDTIGIDEVQFFPDAVECIQELANSGKHIIAAGLDADFRAKPFDVVANLMAISETILKLKSICNECGEDASFSKRIINDNNLVVIGGHESYSAVCRKCMWGLEPQKLQ